MSDLVCPVIHKVSENGTEAEKCPVPHNQQKPQQPSTGTSSHEDINEGIVGREMDAAEDPTMEEYKRLRRVMGMITKFYENGTLMKKGHYDDVTVQIGKLDEDQKMTQMQIDVLDKLPAYKKHSKVQQYKKNLEEEFQQRQSQRKGMAEKQTEFLKLSQWSLGIVECCHWLEANMEEYCINELKMPLKRTGSAPPPLTEEKRQHFAKGLAEITFNLDESQDFFSASIDGRLLQYHNVEREAILAQLEVVRQFAPENPRRQAIEEELMKDLEYVESNMEETDESKRRKEKMLANHKEFLKVLKFYKAKVGLHATEEIKFDSKYNLIQ